MGREEGDGEFRFPADTADDATSDDTGAFEFGDESDSGGVDDGAAKEVEAVDVEQDHDHAHHPVVEDWPRGVGEASWWPIVTALGAAAVDVSIALFLLGCGRNSLVSPAVGPLAFLGAGGITLFGVYGWLYHGFVAHF